MNPFVRLQVTKPWQQGGTFVDKLDTTSRQSTKNPVWEEEFSFLISVNEGPGELQLRIWDSKFFLFGHTSPVAKAVDVDLSRYVVGQPYKKAVLLVDVSVVSSQRQSPSS